jgi:O-antigen/teichoic acid export membrane protein
VVAALFREYGRAAPLLRNISFANDNTIDRVGVVASCVCAVHCAVMPFVIGLLPLFGLGIFADQRTEWALVAVSLVVGLSSLLPAYLRKHKRTRPLFLFTIGLALIFIARVTFEDTLRAEIPFVVLGALLIAASHFLNRRLCRACPVCPTDCT